MLRTLLPALLLAVALGGPTALADEGKAPPPYEPKKLGPSLRDQALDALSARKLDEAAALYRRWLEADPKDDTSWYNLACVLALLGKKDEALTAFETSIDAGFDDLDHAGRDSDLDSIRADARFAAAVERGRAAKKAAELPGMRRHALPTTTLGSYIVLLPPDYDTSEKRYPVVFILHGSGSTEVRHARVTKDLGREGVIYVAPRALHPHTGVFLGRGQAGWTAWPPERGEPERDEAHPMKHYASWVLRCADDVAKRYRTRGDRFHLWGHSQGAAAATCVAMLHPKRVASFFAYAGYYPEEIVTDATIAGLETHGVHAELCHRHPGQRRAPCADARHEGPSRQGGRQPRGPHGGREPRPQRRGDHAESCLGRQPRAQGRGSGGAGRQVILDDLSQAIGDTALLKLDRFAPESEGRLLAKLELFNPYSIKDRPVRAMVDAAVARGALAPGGTVVEATSGNTGMALAMISAARGYHCVLVMSEIQSIERRQVLAALGAELVLTPKEGGTKAAKAEAMRIAAERGAFYLGQHDNPANPDAHEATTGPELWEATEGAIDVLVAGLGTGGTLVGVARAIKPRKPSFTTVGVEPEGSPFISQGIFRPHRMMGTAPGFVPGVLDRELVDDIALVSEEDAFEACRRIARSEGILVGISSGATAHAARRLAREMPDKLIVCVFCDTGQRYLSVEGLFDGT